LKGPQVATNSSGFSIMMLFYFNVIQLEVIIPRRIVNDMTSVSCSMRAGSIIMNVTLTFECFCESLLSNVDNSLLGCLSRLCCHRCHVAKVFHLIFIIFWKFQYEKDESLRHKPRIDTTSIATLHALAFQIGYLFP